MKDRSQERTSEYARNHQKQYRRRRHLNGGQTLSVDIDVVRPYITAWLSEGYSFRAMERFTGLSNYTLQRISSGETTRVMQSTADLIRNANPDIRRLLPKQLVDATGTRRRVQALHLAGWSWRELDRQRGLGERSDQTRRLCRRVMVSKKVHDDIVALTERLWLKQPPTGTSYERRDKSKATNWARRNGWVPLAAWDDIDDPNETPKGVITKRSAA